MYSLYIVSIFCDLRELETISNKHGQSRGDTPQSTERKNTPILIIPLVKCRH